ncbi:hypothetical protein BDZ94DRAFT_1294437 [Collybia nuda]|uniref:Uncharacterized protein n=1 Tax=Collybia nuda TaxID=64659 RepID=A0A9P5YGD8_9AGAR|nr:hypothetical protein BDZ94DRAFT_1294437 [Collybia nuda]
MGFTVILEDELDSLHYVPNFLRLSPGMRPEMLNTIKTLGKLREKKEMAWLEFRVMPRLALANSLVIEVLVLLDKPFPTFPPSTSGKLLFDSIKDDPSRNTPRETLDEANTDTILSANVFAEFSENMSTHTMDVKARGVKSHNGSMVIFLNPVHRSPHKFIAMPFTQIPETPRQPPPDWAVPFSNLNADWANDAGIPIKPFKNDSALWLRAAPTDPISPRRIKKLIRAYEAAKFPTGKEPEGPRPYAEYKRKRICYIPSEDDVRPLMMIQQMIADSYADARIMWGLNKNRAPQKCDHLGLYGPNNVQQGIEERLMDMRLLSRPALDAVIYREAPRPLPLSRWSRCLRKMTGKRSQEDDDEEYGPLSKEGELHSDVEHRSSMKLWHALLLRFKFLNSAKTRPWQDVNRQGSREYLPYAVVCRPELPAIARFAPCIKPRLRRTTRADARRLRRSSIRYIPRQEIIPPLLPPPISVYIPQEFKHWGPIDYEDLMSLPWPKGEVKPEFKPLPLLAPSVVATKGKITKEEEEENIPYHIAAGIIFFWICVLSMLFLGLILAAILSCVSTVTSFLFPSSEKD